MAIKQSFHFVHELPPEGNVEDVAMLLSKHWGSAMIVTRGKVTDATRIPRITVREADGRLVGLVTYQVDHENHSCEVISLNSEIEGLGIGTRLLEMVETEAKEKGCKHIWLITTNDNPEAAAFYVKKGYRLTKVHLNAIDKSRELKPQISKVGKHGLPLIDEWEFEKTID